MHAWLHEALLLLPSRISMHPCTPDPALHSLPHHFSHSSRSPNHLCSSMQPPLQSPSPFLSPYHPPCPRLAHLHKNPKATRWHAWEPCVQTLFMVVVHRHHRQPLLPNQSDHHYLNHLQPAILRSRALNEDPFDADHDDDISFVSNATTVAAVAHHSGPAWPHWTRSRCWWHGIRSDTVLDLVPASASATCTARDSPSCARSSAIDVALSYDERSVAPSSPPSPSVAFVSGTPRPT